MKKVTLLLTAALLALAAVPSFSATPADAGEKIIVKTKTIDAKTIKILLANLEKEKTLVTIESLNGKAYFRERIFKHNGYLLQINMEKLPEGRYLLKVRNDEREITQVIVVKKEQILLSHLDN